MRSGTRLVARRAYTQVVEALEGLSPEAVIVGGEIARAWPLISEELIKAVEEYSLCRGMKSARIIPSTLGDTPTLMGALSLVLSSKFAAVTTA